MLQLIAPVRCVYCSAPKTLLCVSHLPEPSAHPEQSSALEGYYAAQLDAVMLSALGAYKDRSLTALAKVFGEMIEPLVATEPWRSADLVVIPPSSAKAYRSRGFVPVRLILNNSQNRLPVIQLGLTRKVADQRGLDARARRANLLGAFSAPSLRGKKVLLFDDVLTSSATLGEMRNCVEGVGAKPTGFCVLARRFADWPNG